MSELQKKHKQLKRLRIRNITLNTVCILLALAGISWTINYFWKYVHYEITNDAVVDQYIAPLNIRASGYIKEVRFTEHQPVHAGDTLLILDNREYLIKVKDAEAALMDAKGAKDVLSSGIQTSQVNVAIQEANIAETKAKLWQQEQDYHRYANLLAEESVSQQQYEQVKTAYEATQARYQALLQQKEAAKSQYSETSRHRSEYPSQRSGSGYGKIESLLYDSHRSLRRIYGAPHPRTGTIRTSRANHLLSCTGQRQMDHRQLQRNADFPHLHRAESTHQGRCFPRAYLSRHCYRHIRSNRFQVRPGSD